MTLLMLVLPLFSCCAGVGVIVVNIHYDVGCRRGDIAVFMCVIFLSIPLMLPMCLGMLLLLSCCYYVVTADWCCMYCVDIAYDGRVDVYIAMLLFVYVLSFLWLWCGFRSYVAVVVVVVILMMIFQ